MATSGFPQEAYDKAFHQCAEEMILPADLVENKLVEDEYSVRSRGYASFPVVRVPQMKADYEFDEKETNLKKQGKKISKKERKRVPYSDKITVTVGEGENAEKYELEKYRIYGNRSFKHILSAKYPRDLKANMFYIRNKGKWVLNVSYVN